MQHHTRLLRNAVISGCTLATLLSTAYLFKPQIDRALGSALDVPSVDPSHEKLNNPLESLRKSPVEYIDTHDLNLVSLAKLKHASIYVHLASKIKTPKFYDKVCNELLKLNDLDDAYAQILQQQLTNDDTLVMHLAFNPKIDNRLFRKEPQTILERLPARSSIGRFRVGRS
jgi:hypothetical protein